MILRFAARVLPFFLFSMAPLCVEPAYAGLGGDAAGVRADAAELGGTVTSILQALYRVEEITSETGMRVREYLSPDGVVFAVGWSGPVQPDLQHLLGAHFGKYAAALAAQNRPGMHRSLQVVLPDLVVESGGHMRAYSGRAYLPASLPAGTPTAALR